MLRRIQGRIERERNERRIDAARRVAIGEGVVYGSGVLTAAGSRVENRYGGLVTLGDRVRLDHGAMVLSQNGDVHIGDDVYIGPYAVLYGGGGLTIGPDTMIAAHVVVVPSNHVFENSGVPIRKQGQTMEGVTIGRDVWVAAHAVILDGVTVGDGAVVAAGAVVRSDVKPFSVVGGVPAKAISRRGAMVAPDSGKP